MNRESIKFGTDGWRAIIAEDFTFANVEKATYAIGLYLKEAYPEALAGKKMPVLVGFDPRFLADAFALRACQVLQAMGFTCRIASRDIPTPTIAWATQAEPTAGALQFTASHNPPEYCGLKYIPPYAGPATNDITSKITEYLKAVPATIPHTHTHPENFDVSAPYLEAILKLVNRGKIKEAKLKIAFDALYSTSRGYLDRALEMLGVEVVSLHNYRDPLFGNGMPEPKPKYLKDLAKTVREEHCHAGVATDGDGDRFAFVDSDGRFFTANESLCLLTQHLHHNRGLTGAVVRNLCTSHMLDHVARLNNLPVVETPVGFKYIGEVMRTQKVLIGGEESGGASIQGHIPEKDGILANLLMIEMLAYEKKSMGEIWSDLTKRVNLTFHQRRKDLHLKQEQQKFVLAALKENPLTELAGEALLKTDLKDGIKLYHDADHWLLLRPSGTEPILRLSGEGIQEDLIDKMMLDLTAKIEEILARLKQPSLANT